MKSGFVLLAVLLVVAGFAWIWIAFRKFAARSKAESAREAAFLAEMSHARAASPAPARSADPLEAAAAKIRQALRYGRGAEAVEVFTAHLEHRARLALAPPEWNSLGRVLLAQGAYLEAAWTLHAGAALAGDPLAAQKSLVEVAGRAGAAGQPQAALRLYAIVLEKYPASEFAQFVHSSMKIEEKKLKA